MNTARAWIAGRPCRFRQSARTFSVVNFFSTDAFLRPLAAAAFKARSTEIRYFALNGRRYRLLAVDGRPVTQFPFLDFVEPCGSAQAGDEPIDWLPVMADGLCRRDEDRAVPDTLPAPTVVLLDFPTTEAYWADVVQRGSRVVAETRRRTRKLEREVGPIEVRIDDDRREVFDTCLRWKSAQYRSSGLADLFADPVNRELFELMRAEGTLKTSSLSAGGKLIAAHINAPSGARYCGWIPAYDQTYFRYAPGTQLLHAVIEHAHRKGFAELDFLIGDESYKWEYATHFRRVREEGTAPLSVRAQKNLKRHVKATLSAAGVLEPLNTLRRKVIG